MNIYNIIIIALIIICIITSFVLLILTYKKIEKENSDIITNSNSKDNGTIYTTKRRCNRDYTTLDYDGERYCLGKGSYSNLESIFPEEKKCTISGPNYVEFYKKPLYKEKDNHVPAGIKLENYTGCKPVSIIVK